jgi:membrane peptidoglycan carboxypeptidase
LNLPEAALMIGLIKAPAMYSPELHPERAKLRRDAVIGAMLRQGTITAQQADAAVNASIP